MPITINGTGSISGLTATGISAQPVFPGNVLQVVSTTKTDTTSTASTTFVDLTGLSVSITPASASNKIYVMFTVSGSHSGTGDNTHLQLLRDSTALGLGDAAGSRPRSTALLAMPSVNAYNLVTASYSYLDSPSSTSSLTYKLQFKVKTGTGFINRTGIDGDTPDGQRTSSTITVMEVAA